jgi:tRNA A37 threonylcarbamoyladenosine modification protein TsaB
LTILAVDTSGAPVSVAVAESGRLCARFWLEHGKTHSEALMPCIEQALAGLGIGAESIGAYAAVVGPGSFTGLRIGVSAVKAMAFARGVQTIGVSSLDSLAYNTMFYSHSMLCPIIDARNSQVYSAIYRLGALGASESRTRRVLGGGGAGCPNGGASAQLGGTGDPHGDGRGLPGGGTLIRVAEPAIRHVSELAGEIGRLLSERRDAPTCPARPAAGAPSGCRPVVFNGDAAPKYMEYFERALADAGCACCMAGERDLLSDAASAALIAHGMAQRGALTPPAMLLPVYLRASQAERRRNELGERR